MNTIKQWIENLALLLSRVVRRGAWYMQKDKYDKITKTITLGILAELQHEWFIGSNNVDAMNQTVERLFEMYNNRYKLKQKEGNP